MKNLSACDDVKGCVCRILKDMANCIGLQRTRPGILPFCNITLFGQCNTIDTTEKSKLLFFFIETIKERVMNCEAEPNCWQR